MDEIQNCIADAQYGEALRQKNTVRPVEHFPDPGPDFDWAAMGEALRCSIKTSLEEPLGEYFLSRFMSENNPTQDEVFILECLAGIRDFKRSSEPDAVRLIHHTLFRLPAEFRKMKAYETLTQLSDQLEKARLEIRQQEAATQQASSAGATSSESSEPINYFPVVIAGNSVLDSSDLSDLEKALREGIMHHWDAFKRSALFERYMRLKWYADQPVSLRNFTIFRDLGRGAFGVVSGARFNTTGSMLAIKQMNKKLVKGKKALRLVQAEKSILEMLGNKPSLFTIWLQYSWADKDQFYLALPLATGGDLAYHLSYQGYFDVERARFTSAEIALGLAHLHSLGIIYRDLKPENVLLEETGHARISDMGLAIHADGRPIKGRAGTPGYWAPEMLKKEKYGTEADWWSFGCCLYEFLAGICPFSKQNTGLDRDEATQNWTLLFPTHLNHSAVTPEKAAQISASGANFSTPVFPEEAKDVIRKLLNRNVQQRLGFGRRGLEDLKNDPFYSGLDWQRLAAHELDPPWIPRPQAINAVNQSELDERNTEYDYRRLKLTEQDEIPNFVYVSTFAHQSDIVCVLELEAAGKLVMLSGGNGPVWCCNAS